MLLKDTNAEFEMRIVGYQFPDLEDVQYDSDWLNISVRATLPQGSWTYTDPSLLTYEVAELADWLDAVADGTAVSTGIGFIEPNLAFEMVEEEPRKLRVYFDAETRPPSAPYDPEGTEELWAEFTVSADDLRTAAASLRKDLEQFPVRVGR
ncbi:MAG TPA: hypothetical protein PKM59_08415 [Thermodesulfobacteriota bacterium]|nr:hypothetical protein [Thermodesulfobacteriota bacterium]